MFNTASCMLVDCVWNVMAHAQKPDFVFRWNGRVHLYRRVRQFSRLLAGELCTSAWRVCTARASLCSAVIWRLLVTHSILLFSPHFTTRASLCAITFQLDSPYCLQQIKVMEVIRPFILLLRHGYRLNNNIKSIRELIMFKDKKWNTRSFM